MAERDVELWIEGRVRARHEDIMAPLAWTQVNLGNIHIPRGKPSIKQDKILPPPPWERKVYDPEDEEVTAELRQQQEEETRKLLAQPGRPLKPHERAEAAMVNLRAKDAKIRRHREREMDADYWSSPEGAKVRQFWEDG